MPTPEENALRRAMIQAAILGIEQADYVDDVVKRYPPDEATGQLMGPPLNLTRAQASQVLYMRVGERNRWRLAELQQELVGLVD